MILQLPSLAQASPIPSPDRFGNSTLVEVGGQRLVFDMGRGVTIRLWQKQIALGSIDVHFVTHLHSDHVNGLSDLWLSGWIQNSLLVEGRSPLPSMVLQEQRR